MKKIFLSLLIASAASYAIAQNTIDPVLMNIGDTKVTLTEFTNVYHKNNVREEAGTKESLEKYLDLFVNFKLKVKEAEELKLDTSKSFIEELKGYRKQLAQPYLTDKDVNEKLLLEAYDRLQYEVKASHILIRIADNALPKDTLAAYNKTLKLRGRILKGEDFGKVASEASEDVSLKERGGDLGYFTALQMVYPFESAAFDTKVGEISMPVRTRFGYHLIKVTDKRRSRGEVLVAHIMVRTSDKMTPQDSANAKIKIDEIYEKIKKGENFAELAKIHSDDKNSGQKGGELQWFSSANAGNPIPNEFIDASFALKNNGDVSTPLQTSFGWHIIKRLDKKEMSSFDAMKGELKAKVSKDSRSQAGRSSLISSIKKEYKFKENLKARDDFYKVVDTTLFEGNWSRDKAKNLSKNMFNLLDKNYTQADFAAYIESHQAKRPKGDVKMTVNAMYTQFVDETCIAFEENRLEEKYPEFKALMQEYREGILLFELTDQKVWSKAVKDTTGLKEYYEKNKNNYLWEERADATIYVCVDEKTAQKVRAMLKKNKSEKDILAEVNKTSKLNVQSESKIFNKGENKVVDANWNPGISVNQKEENGRVSFVVVHKLMKPEPKAFNEAKGLITADYQNYLEKEWIASLKQKYKVEINYDVLTSVK